MTAIKFYDIGVAEKEHRTTEKETNSLTGKSLTHTNANKLLVALIIEKFLFPDKSFVVESKVEVGRMFTPGLWLLCCAIKNSFLRIMTIVKP